MRRRFLLRLLSVFITLIVVSLLVFSLQRLSLGDSSSYLLSEDLGEAELNQYRETMGLNSPFLLSYLSFIKSFFTLSWGENSSGIALSFIIKYRASVTLLLTLYSVVILAVLAFICCRVVAINRRGKVASALRGICALLMATPSFLVALAFVLIFSIKLKLFPVSGYTPIEISIFGNIRALFLPSLTLALSHLPIVMRILSRGFKREMEAEYADAYRASGASERNVFYSYSIRSMIPMLSNLLSQAVASLLAGSAIIETVFALPGLGAYLVSAALKRELKESGIAVMLIAIFSSLCFIANELIALISDPRLRLGDKR